MTLYVRRQDPLRSGAFKNKGRRVHRHKSILQATRFRPQDLDELLVLARVDVRHDQPQAGMTSGRRDQLDRFGLCGGRAEPRAESDI